jgi:hypothetical protein
MAFEQKNECDYNSKRQVAYDVWAWIAVALTIEGRADFTMLLKTGNKKPEITHDTSAGSLKLSKPFCKF